MNKKIYFLIIVNLVFGSQNLKAAAAAGATQDEIKPGKSVSSGPSYEKEYTTATRLKKLGKYELAENKYLTAARSSDVSIQAKSLYNLGWLASKSQDYEKSYVFFEAATRTKDKKISESAKNAIKEILSERRVSITKDGQLIIKGTSKKPTALDIISSQVKRNSTTFSSAVESIKKCETAMQGVYFINSASRAQALASAVLSPVSRSVGLLKLECSLGYSMGTTFHIGDGLVMTAGHVVSSWINMKGTEGKVSFMGKDYKVDGYKLYDTKAFTSSSKDGYPIDCAILFSEALRKANIPVLPLQFESDLKSFTDNKVTMSSYTFAQLQAGDTGLPLPIKRTMAFDKKRLKFFKGVSSDKDYLMLESEGKKKPEEMVVFPDAIDGSVSSPGASGSPLIINGKAVALNARTRPTIDYDKQKWIKEKLFLMITPEIIKFAEAQREYFLESKKGK